MPADLEDAWDDLHDATPPSWFVGRPTYVEGRGVWEMYAFDTRERAKHSHRSREWRRSRRRSSRSSASWRVACG